jgi:hypothetical protein
LEIHRKSPFGHPQIFTFKLLTYGFVNSAFELN